MQVGSCLSDRGDSLECVAIAYGIRDFSMCLGYLEAHGIVVVAKQWHLIANLPHYAGAVGGIPIRVPARQAQRTTALLRSIEAEPDQGDDRRAISYRVWIAVLFIALLGFAAAPPSSGLVVNCRNQTQRVPQNDK
ncbi:hypothetical protein PDO_0975 [Rhizobium sp. PDO1-076]|uniref:hypothetical protein n=1 Tax=Rhizobium sp. PDO1-076 TaxID=1125979 RepID=UPI00024E252B|nr:hypothetical protein [Rhizobium sp. PDO1-076]EHS53793.1 hypothetical protein PDO_0975 [Rhizobium sp. PDO1-076]